MKFSTSVVLSAMTVGMSMMGASADMSHMPGHAAEHCVANVCDLEMKLMGPVDKKPDSSEIETMITAELAKTANEIAVEITGGRRLKGDERKLFTANVDQDGPLSYAVFYYTPDGSPIFLVTNKVYYDEQFFPCSNPVLGSQKLVDDGYTDCYNYFIKYRVELESDDTPDVIETNVATLNLDHIPEFKFLDDVVIELRQRARKTLEMDIQSRFAPYLPGGEMDDEVLPAFSVEESNPTNMVKVEGDPHFKTFSGSWFDYMGACDLKMIHAPAFDGESALEVDVRTKIRYDYSFVESAALKLGDDVLEVGSFGEYWLNGVNSAKMPAILANKYPVTREQPSEKVTVFTIQINDNEKIVLKNFKDMVAVIIDEISPERLSGAVGMTGTFNKGGRMIGRDGETVIEDPNAFADEWQIRSDEPMLFHAAAGPQAPQKCELPNPTAAKGRRLGETIALEAAEKACAKWAADNKDACIHDVMALGDLELAAAGAY